MPDFRARVHRGETFVIAGDRFAIGSSREMSPAGLKGVAEEAGLEMVVVCGHNMGDIFRRNALQPRAARRAEPRGGGRRAGRRRVRVRSRDARGSTNDTQGKTYEPVPLTPKEDEIRRSGGIFAVGPPRVPARRSRRRPSIEWPDARRARAHDDDRADRLGAPRRQGRRRCDPGATLRVYADLLPASDGTAPFCDPHLQPDHRRRHDLPAAGRDRQRPLRLHRQATPTTSRPAIGREFARLHGIEKPYYATPGDGIFHFYFPEQGLVMPGQFIPGADSHSRAYGAYGAVGIGVGSTTLGFGWATGYIYFTLAEGSGASSFSGRLQPWVSGKDIVLELLRRWGAKQSQGMSVEFVDADRQLPIAYRNTIANMMAEAEALNGIFAPDDDHLRVVPRARA